MNDDTTIGPTNDTKLIMDADIPLDIYLSITHGGELPVNMEEKYPDNPPGTQYL